MTLRSALRLAFFCLLTAWISRASAQLSSTVTSAATSISLPKTLVLSGTADWTVGSTHDSGNLTLRVGANGSVEENWQLSKLRQTFKQGGLDGDRSCTVAAGDAAAVSVTDQRCMRIVPWFAPWLAAKTVADGNSVQVDSTLLSEKTAGEQKLTVSSAYPGLPTLSDKKKKALDELVALSAVQVTYDVKSSLPLRLSFVDSPDNDKAHGVETYVFFSDYRLDQGLMLPHRIKRYVQGTLQLDFQVSNVTTN